MHLIDGKSLANQHLAELREKISRNPVRPGLAIVLVGDDPASHLYVRLKEKACQSVGITFEKHVFPLDTTAPTITELIGQLNRRPDIHGIVVQLPLPSGLDQNQIIQAIEPTKDVDGFHPANLEHLRQGHPTLIPALTQSILDLIESTGRPLSGLDAVVIANSRVFAEPMILQLRTRSVQTEFVGTDPHDPRVALADILIVAVGRPKLVTLQHVKDGAILIDVGITETSHGVEGDVDRVSFLDSECWVTPVPGGVGPMTVAHLLLNTYQAAQAALSTLAPPQS